MIERSETIVHRWIQYEPGDRIRAVADELKNFDCHDEVDKLVYGQVYTVLDYVEPFPGYPHTAVVFIDNNGVRDGWPSRLFEIVKEDSQRG